VDATVERITAAAAFRANLKVLQSADQMSNDLLELLTRR
jgi:flagellar basal body rod protein FlgC